MIEITATKPQSLLQREVNIDFRNFVKAVGNAAAHVATGQYDEILDDAIEAAASFGLGSTESELAWMLVRQALVRGIWELISEHRDVLFVDATELSGVQQKLNFWIGEDSFVLDSTLFDRPGEFAGLDTVRKSLKDWLSTNGLSPLASASITERLSSYFTHALHHEWSRSPERWRPIQNVFDTPFTHAADGDRAWMRYETWLWRQLDEPLFGEAFGLKSLYVPLRAYWENNANDLNPSGAAGFSHPGSMQASPRKRIVVDLERELDSWLQNRNREDAIRVISGGPGSGKTSFVRRYAARSTTALGWRCLYVPLHLFDPKDDLVRAVGDFVITSRILPVNPLCDGTLDRPLLLLFDGLDELAMRGPLSERVAEKFVGEVERTVSRLNLTAARVFALLSGREVVVQANASEFRRPKQVLHMLPYFVLRDERSTSFAPEDWVDEQDLLAVDQRDVWWEKYHAAAGGAREMPPAFREGELNEVTAQPLLNYLVALSHMHGKHQIGPDTNLNVVYSDLVDAVYERAYEGNRRHRAIHKISQKEFIRVLQEIAVSSWHGNGRTTTVSAIRKHCEKAQSTAVLHRFQEGAEAGVTRLLAAFYFRQHGHDSLGDQTFEFTHKSFGEYLTSARIVRLLSLISEQRCAKEEDSDRGWTVDEALGRWLDLMGPTALDGYLLRFLKRDIARSDPKQVAEWQRRIAEMLSACVRVGMPFSRLDPRPTFIEEQRYARNAEEALLAGASACAAITKTITEVTWPSRTTPGEVIRRLQGQRSGPTNRVAMSSLSNLDLGRPILDMSDLYDADMEGANLSDASLQFAALSKARLSRANLRGATIAGCWISEVHWTRADFSHANLRSLDLTRARFIGCDFSDASFDLLSIRGARADGARLQDVLVPGATESATPVGHSDVLARHILAFDITFEFCNFQGARIRYSTLKRAVFTECKFVGVKIDEYRTSSQLQRG